MPIKQKYSVLALFKISSGFALRLSLVLVFLQTSHAKETENYEFFSIVNRYFSKWDLDKNGTLSQYEIGTAILDPDNQGERAAALSALKRRESRQPNANSPSFTLETLKEAEADPIKARPFLSKFKNAQKKLSAESSLLFPPGSPRLERMHQGKTGDCYLIAVAGALVSQRPEEIKDLIHERAAGNFEVNFHGVEPVVVERPTDGEIASYGEATGDGIWLSVLEKAFATLKLAEDPKLDENRLYQNISGGHARDIINLLTGHNSKRYLLKDTSDLPELRRTLSEALGNKRIVATGISSLREDGKRSSHALAVIAFDPESDMLTIWNPWGTSKKYKSVDLQMKNGIFTMPLPEWSARFKAMLVEESD